MNEDRTRILKMLAEGKISAEEAESLLDALDSRGATPGPTPGAAPSASAVKGDPTPLLEALPKTLYVKVDSQEGDTVDVKVPIALVRSGLRLTSVIPPQAMEQINEKMSAQGISLDFSNLKPEDIDELVRSLREMEIKIDSKNGDQVRVYCE